MCVPYSIGCRFSPQTSRQDGMVDGFEGPTLDAKASARKHSGMCIFLISMRK
jgi:hypothetical protein